MISIHAPLRGATKFGKTVFLTREISIHAPLRGATDKRQKTDIEPLDISIHAPLRGATIL